jgi:hypothetical protein
MPELGMPALPGKAARLTPSATGSSQANTGRIDWLGRRVECRSPALRVNVRIACEVHCDLTACCACTVTLAHTVLTRAVVNK